MNDNSNVVEITEEIIGATDKSGQQMYFIKYNAEKAHFIVAETIGEFHFRTSIYII